MIYIVRHGLDNEDYIGGWSDGKLVDEGIKQVEKLASWINDNIRVKKIITSDIIRAIQTADIINRKIGVDIVKTSNLREQNKGLLNGILKEDAKRMYPKVFDNLNPDTVFPNGESLRNLYVRMKQILLNILEYPDDTLIVTHRGVINMIYYILNEIELDMDKEKFNVTHASIHELDAKQKKIRKLEV